MNRFILLAVTILALTIQAYGESRLERLDPATGLVVDGKPFFIIGGETGNSMASCPKDVTICMRKAEKHGYNTVLIPATWELIEPKEGSFDFTSIDEIIRQANEKELKVVLLWFGAWKNSMSCYAPSWFKADTKRFPRARTREGKPLEIASAFSDKVYEADSKAFSRLLRHIAETDTAGTVIMLQLENEIGMLEDARDHSPLALAEYKKGVPPGLITHLNKNKKSLHPQLKEKWQAAGMKQKGSWAEVFGDDIYTDEIFMAWNYGLYVERLAKEARKVFPDMPLYVNAAMNSRGRRPGEYPSAGPLAHLKDIWHAAAPTLDFLSPDLYDKGFTDWVAAYALPDNPLFIPEIKTARGNCAQAHYIIGEYGAIGLSPFAYNLRRYSDAAYQREGNLRLRSLFPLLATCQGKGMTNGFYFDADSTVRVIDREGLRITAKHYFTLPWDPRATDGSEWPATGGLIIRLSPMEYIVAGSGIVLTFEPSGSATASGSNLGEDGFLNSASDRSSAGSAKWHGKRIGLSSVEEVEVAPDGTLGRIRTFNGDETHQGRHVRIGVDNFKILHVKLYEYE